MYGGTNVSNVSMWFVGQCFTLCMKTKISGFSRTSAFMARLLFCSTTLTLKKNQTLGLPFFFFNFLQILIFLHNCIHIEFWFIFIYFSMFKSSLWHQMSKWDIRLQLKESFLWVRRNTGDCPEDTESPFPSSIGICIGIGSVLHYFCPSNYSLVYFASSTILSWGQRVPLASILPQIW
jgi:hypothetical protein